MRQKIIERLRVDFSEASTEALVEIADSDPDEVLRGIAVTWLVDPKRGVIKSGRMDFTAEKSRIVSSALARSLAKDESDASIDLLGELVLQSEPSARWPALKSLRSISGPRVADAVAPALSDPEMVVRLLAAEILAATGDSRSVELLRRRVEEESGTARTSMQKSLEVALRRKPE